MSDDELRFDFKVKLLEVRDNGVDVEIRLLTPSDGLYFVMVFDRRDPYDPHRLRSKLGMLKEAVRECRLLKQERDAAPAHEKLSDGTLLRLGLQIDGLFIVGLSEDERLVMLSRSQTWPEDGAVERISFEDAIGRWDAARILDEARGA